MKVTYTKNRFEIDGVQVINPQVLSDIWRILHYGRLKDGDFFSLPDNIIAEKERSQSNCNYCKLDCLNNLNGMPCKAPEVYRLKLKEPLVDSAMTLRTFDYKYEREKYIKSIKRIEDCPFSDMVKNMDEQNPLVDTGSKETQEQILIPDGSKWGITLEQVDSKLNYDKIKEVNDALGEPGIGSFRIVENQFLADDMIIVSSKIYKALKVNP